MPSKVVIPKRISKTVRSFGLSRNLVVGLFNRIYGDLPSASRAVRTDDQREFVFQSLCWTPARAIFSRYLLTMPQLPIT